MKDIITKDGSKNIYIDLSNISHDANGKRLWKESVGKTFIIGYNDEYVGEFKICDYDHIKHIITMQSIDTGQVSTITTTGIYNCNIDKKIKPFLKHKYKLSIPMNITDYNRNLTLIDSKTKNVIGTTNNKTVERTYEYYLYHCNICGNEDWVKYEDLMNWQHSGCNVCANKKILIGYNDIPTTAPWMVDYFQGGYDEAVQYTCQSNQKIYPICPDCGRIKNKPISISNIYYNHSIGCVCSDGLSYPNKFSYALLEQLPVNNWMNEYTPEWAGRFRYDNYFEYNGNKYILEMDGGFHYKDNDLNGMVVNEAKAIDDF